VLKNSGKGEFRGFRRICSVGREAKSPILLDVIFRDFNEIRPAEPLVVFFNTIGR